MMTALSTLKAEEEFCQVVMKKPETGIINHKTTEKILFVKGFNGNNNEVPVCRISGTQFYNEYSSFILGENYSFKFRA